MRIGLVLENLGNTQSVFMAVNHINGLISQKIFRDITLFVCETVPVCVKPLCAVVNVDRAFQFNHTLIATNLSTASLISKANGHKILYLWDLEWLYGYGNYIDNVALLKNSGFTVLCRSEWHQKVIKNYCGVDAPVVTNFNLKTIIDNFGVPNETKSN